MKKTHAFAAWLALCTAADAQVDTSMYRVPQNNLLDQFGQIQGLANAVEENKRLQLEQQRLQLEQQRLQLEQQRRNIEISQQQTGQARQLTDAEIRLQAAGERMMDSGEMPFVIHNGARLPLTEKEMERFGLRRGQTINSTIYFHILCSNPLIREGLPQCQ